MRLASLDVGSITKRHRPTIDKVSRAGNGRDLPPYSVPRDGVGYLTQRRLSRIPH